MVIQQYVRKTRRPRVLGRLSHRQGLLPTFRGQAAGAARDSADDGSACLAESQRLVPRHPTQMSALMTLHFDNPDLTTDPAARRAIKDERVAVEFATERGQLVSAVGVNHYAAGDALVTGSTG